MIKVELTLPVHLDRSIKNDKYKRLVSSMTDLGLNVINFKMKFKFHLQHN